MPKSETETPPIERPESIVWLTRDYPFVPDRGDLLYTDGLLRALSGLGCDVDLFCYGEHRDKWLPERVRMISIAAGSPDGGLFSWLNGETRMLVSVAMEEAVRRRIEAGAVRAVVIDYYAMGWIFDDLVRLRGRIGGRFPIVYVSHNYEGPLRRQIAWAASGIREKVRLAVQAVKIDRLESRLLATADLVTTNTDEDLRAIRKAGRATPIVTLVPGYGETPDLGPDIDATRPRTAVIVGSFDWVAKRHNLLRFLEATDAAFRRAGIGVLVIGRGPADFMRETAATFDFCRFTGPVEDVRPHLCKGRIGVMPDTVGGGFKHKYLSYIFNGLPFATIADQAVGLPLIGGEDYVSGADLAAVVDGIVGVIDDLPRLKAMRRQSFEKSAGYFDWRESGRRLVAALESLRRA